MDRSNINTTEALGAYFKDGVVSCEPYGNGHINDTFLVVAKERYIMQRMNTSIFPDTEKLMENILGVTEHILSKAESDVERSTLTVVPAPDGKSFFRDGSGNCWRVYKFVEGTVAWDRVESLNDFYRCGEAFGKFQRMLADYPAHKLHESIRDFHNTPKRYENLMRSVERDACKRLSEVLSEVEFARERESFCRILESAREAGTLPLRVTHNDTKLNNILFDAKTGAPVCVIDLDTVMPGYSVTDFGDSIRFGANTAAEDETDLSRVSLDLELFEAYASGFMKSCADSLYESEIDLLPIGAIMMTLECGMRFLTDYLDGDVYFRIHRPRHNLERARNQFALVADMERKLPEMRKIISRLKNA